MYLLHSGFIRSNLFILLTAFTLLVPLFGTSDVDASSYTVRIRSIQAGGCLEVRGASTANGANIGTWNCLNQNNQRWRITDTGRRWHGHPVVEIRNVHSGKCLDMRSWSGANGDNIHQWTCHGQNSQRWILQRVGVEYTRIRSVLHRHQCADLQRWTLRDNVHTWGCHGANSQLWWIG